MYSYHDSFRWIVLLFLMVVLFFLWQFLSKAQKKLTSEQKARILDASLQKRNYFGTFVFIAFWLTYLTIEKIFPFILTGAPHDLLFIIIALALITLGTVTNILYFKRMRKMQLPKEYRRRMIIYKVGLVACILIYIAIPYFEKIIFPDAIKITDMPPNATMHQNLITCPSPEEVSSHLVDRLNWKNASAVWSITFIYRQPQADEKVLALFQALLINNSLECYYHFGNPNSQIGGAQWMIVQSQLGGMRRIDSAGYNWAECQQKNCKICNATVPDSCPVSVKF